ncbi:unnamed protein product [Prunus armeniaca]|uniref:GRDP C2 domain-containing protein n=1 Tax=Prunus armeniaca TaxID=36596 RepID=A0A6J5TVY2_PRUAR|nr:unnamed protein product [Prunus armeniaca]
MERKQELEWSEAQKIVISRDLVAAAKQQLQFLAVVDRNRHLYDSPALYKAINRYKYAEFQVRYVIDCASLYRRILDNKNVVSSTQRTCKTKTEEIWNKLYRIRKIYAASESTKYASFSSQKANPALCYQVSRSYVNDNLLLKGAVAGYKETEIGLLSTCVPTYDIDLIWHSHQLHPASYDKDLVAIMRKVLEHDDTDSDRTNCQKLDVGFSEITKQWEEIFSTRYWRAGAMYHGGAPSPLTISLTVSANCNYKQLVLIVAVKDLPVGHKGSLFVSFSKKQPDLFFNTRRRINISSESEEMVSGFQCEPTGHMLFELMSYSPSILSISKTPILLKTITLEDLLGPVSKLQVEKWFGLMANSAVVGSKPIILRIAFSLTTLILSSYVLHMVCTCPLSKSCFLSLSGRFQNAKSWTCTVGEADNELMSIQMRNPRTSRPKCTLYIALSHTRKIMNELSGSIDGSEP